MASAIEKERTALEGGGYMRDCVEAAYWVGQDPVNMGDCEVAGRARGNALQEIFRENKMDSIFVVDIKNENIGKKTFYGYEIVYTQQVNGLGNVIIATNKSIYRYLKNKYIQDKMLLIDLEKFCPYD